MKFKEFEITELFNLVKGYSKYTTKYGHENQGEYPVYSASTKSPLTYINTYDYSGTYLSWTTNGYGGYIFILSGEFSINGDRALLIPKVTNLSLEYIRFVAQPIFRSLARGRIIDGKKNEYTKVYPSMLENTYIEIPIKEDGSFDLEAQNKIAKKYELVEKTKRQAIDYLKTIKNCIVKVELNKDTQYKKVDLKEIFNFYKGNAKYTNEYFFNIVGEYPVYSGATKNLGLVAHIDTYDYDTNGKQWLTWTTDGVYAGTVFVRNGKFSMNTHCGLLKPKDNFDSNLDIEYIAWVLNQTLPNHAIGDQNMRVTMGIINEVSIEIPIKEDGMFDLQEQQRIAKKYQNIESKRSQAIDMLKRVIDTQVKITME